MHIVYNKSIMINITYLIKDIKKDSDRSFDDLGLRASASQQPSVDKIHELFKDVGPLCVVDLREETHLYVDGFPISIANEMNDANHRRPFKEINREESMLTARLMCSESVDLWQRTKLEKDGKREKRGVFLPLGKESVVSSFTEAQFVRGIGARYCRLPTTDHQFLSDQAIDSLIDLHEMQQDEKFWIHVHCAAGKGRTSAAITILALLTLAKEKSLAEVCSDFQQKGNLALEKLSRVAEQRGKKDFWQKFHAFAHARSPGMKWSSWLSKCSGSV